MSDQVNIKNQNITIKLKGNYQMLDQLFGLYESGELENALGFSILELEAFSLKKITTEQEDIVPEVKIVDIAKIPPNTMTVQESAIATISPIIETIKNEVNSLFDFWRECLEFKGMQIVRGESMNRVIQFPQVYTELSVTVSEINETEVQVFLKVRAVDGNGYLPENLIISIFDDEGQLIPNIQIAANTNSFDITHNQKFICGLGDRFSLSLTLGNETVVENFPR